MQPLRVSQLPFTRSNDDSASDLVAREGFVDESVVMELLKATAGSRVTSVQSDLILSAEDLDFAGWSLPEAKVSQDRLVPVLNDRIETESHEVAPLRFTEARSPVDERSQLGWRMALIAGLLAILICTFILFNLSNFSS